MNMFVYGGALNSNIDCDVFDIAGRLVGKVRDGKPFSLPAHGLYIVNAGTKSVKMVY